MQVALRQASKLRWKRALQRHAPRASDDAAGGQPAAVANVRQGVAQPCHERMRWGVRLRQRPAHVADGLGQQRVDVKGAGLRVQVPVQRRVVYARHRKPNQKVGHNLRLQTGAGVVREQHVHSTLQQVPRSVRPVHIVLQERAGRQHKLADGGQADGRQVPAVDGPSRDAVEKRRVRLPYAAQRQRHRCDVGAAEAQVPPRVVLHRRLATPAGCRGAPQQGGAGSHGHHAARRRRRCGQHSGPNRCGGARHGASGGGDARGGTGNDFGERWRAC